MSYPHGTIVTVRVNAQSARDAYGDSTDQEPSEAEWGPCAFAPRTSVERQDERAPAVVTGLTIYGPQPGPASGAQVVIASGVYAGTWEVEGIPGEWDNPYTGSAPGVEVAVTRASDTA